MRETPSDVLGVVYSEDMADLTDSQLLTELAFAKVCAEGSPDTYYITHWKLVATEANRRGLRPR